MKILNRLVDFFDKDRADLLPEDLIGSEILAFGAVILDTEIENERFAIEYKTKSGEVKTILFGFTETGIWIDKIFPE